MREFKKRRTPRGELRRLSIRVCGVLVLAVVALFAAEGTWGMYTKLAEANIGEESTQGQLAAMQAQTAQVQSSVEELSSQRGVEAQMRERYGVALPGEGVIQVVRDQASSTPPSAPQESVWQRLWNTLFVW